MACTLTDIARKTGFSVSTVSRVLHDQSRKYKISEETRAAVRRAAEELGYTPNKLARGLRLSKTHQIGVIVPDVSNPFFAVMVKSFSKGARRAGYSIIVSDSDEESNIEEESLQALLENRVDGLLIAAVGQEYGHIRDLKGSGPPVVMVDRWSSDLEVDAISVDNFKGSYLATEYLLREGHRKIALIQGRRGTNANEGRLQGFLKAMKGANVSVQPQYTVGDDFGTLNGYIETKSLLQLKDPPSAIFAAGDLIALGVLQALKEESVVIPKNISLITFDDPSFASYLSPPLTAVEQPVEKMGEMAVQLLIRRMRAPDAEIKQVLLEPRLIVRDSVARITQLVDFKSKFDSESLSLK
jgi:LacI family transcriptional regulator